MGGLGMVGQGQMAQGTPTTPETVRFQARRCVSPIRSHTRPPCHLGRGAGMRRATAISTVYHRGIPDLPTDCPISTPFASQAVPIRPYPDRGLVNRGVTKASLLVRPNRRVWGWQQSIPDDKGCSIVVSRDIAIEQPFFFNLRRGGATHHDASQLPQPDRAGAATLATR
jgi:hypothetical protein